MKKSFITTIVASLFAMALAFTAQAGTFQYYESADGSPALRVYNGYTGTVSIVITTNGAGNNMSVTCDGLANTVDGSGTTDTIAELAAAIVACTNSSGTASLTVDQNCALAADSTDGELLDGTYTAAAKKWLEIPWDTSAALHYDVYIPANTAQYPTTTRANMTIDKLYGNPIGTGAGNAKIYLDRTLVWEQTLNQPSTVSATNDAVLVVSANIPVNEAVGINAMKKGVLVRVSRATTATTGSVGIIVTEE